MTENSDHHSTFKATPDNPANILDRNFSYPPKGSIEWMDAANWIKNNGGDNTKSDVFRFRYEGLSHKEICERLGVTNAYITQVLRKGFGAYLNRVLTAQDYYARPLPSSDNHPLSFINARLQNCLYLDSLSFEAVNQMPDEDLIRVPGLGRKSLKELRAICADLAS